MKFRIIKNLDIFSHKVRLNFDKNGDSHGTLCGGLTTLIFWVLVIIISAQKFDENRNKYQENYLVQILENVTF